MRVYEDTDNADGTAQLDGSRWVCNAPAQPWAQDGIAHSQPRNTAAVQPVEQHDPRVERLTRDHLGKQCIALHRSISLHASEVVTLAIRSLAIRSLAIRSPTPARA